MKHRPKSDGSQQQRAALDSGFPIHRRSAGMWKPKRSEPFIVPLLQPSTPQVLKVMESYENVLEFWFGREGTEQFGRARDEWFKKSPAFDVEIRARFAGLQAAAAAHELDEWKSIPRGRLALILLLDQFSRNLYRDSPQAFACDAQALRLAQEALDAGLGGALPPIERMFLYMPF